MAACRTKPKLSRHEPGSVAIRTDRARGINSDCLRRERSAVTSQAENAVAGRLNPFFGIILGHTGEGKLVVILRFRHQISRPLRGVSVIQRGFINIPRAAHE